MECEKQAGRGGGDSLELIAGDRPFDSSATAWLVGQGVRYLHAANEDGKLAYQRVVELLGSCKDAVKTVTQLIQPSAKVSSIRSKKPVKMVFRSPVDLIRIGGVELLTD